MVILRIAVVVVEVRDDFPGDISLYYFYTEKNPSGFVSVVESRMGGDGHG